MKRKNLIFILTAFVLCLVFALAGCSDNTPDSGDLPKDTTPYYTVTFDSQGGSNVESQKVRQGNPIVCPDVPERESYSFLGWYKSVGEDAEEWKFATDRVERDLTLYAKWQSSEVQTPTEHLTFEQKGNGYVVTGTSGQEERVIIPAEHNGLPVTEIGESAFAYSRHKSDITYVSVPDSVTIIGLNAFHNRSELVTIDISGTSSLTSIGRNAFSGNHSLKGIYLPVGLTEIGDSAFNNCGGLDSITVAADNAVYRSINGHLIECATQTLIRGCNNGEIPDGVKAIAQAAFRRASNIESLSMPKSVENIANYIIADSSITRIDYAGTEVEWNEIAKSKMWNYGKENLQINFAQNTPVIPKPPIEEDKDISVMYLYINGNKIEVTLADNSSVDALIERLKQNDIVFTATDNAFEIYGSIGQSLPTNNTQISAQAGDVLLWAGNNICIFYGGNSYSYTRLGKINGYTVSELRTLLGAGSGSVQVRISLT